jgi:hypothetical protein
MSFVVYVKVPVFCHIRFMLHFVHEAEYGTHWEETASRQRGVYFQLNVATPL